MTDYNQNFNQTPEQRARDRIDEQLKNAGWLIQDVDQINLTENDSHKCGIAVREFQTNVGPADYMLFIDGVAYGVIEAKKAEMGENITKVEEQSVGYAKAGTKYQNTEQTIRFLYEATGVITKFSDLNDMSYSSRKVFAFHQPEELYRLIHEDNTLRNNLKSDFPSIKKTTTTLRQCQIIAINGLEKSLANNKPRALIQMATGAGKTYTAISEVYRLLKFANAKRVLWLVDTKNLGKQALEEFQAFIPQDDNRNFTDLYQVNRLQRSLIPSNSQVVISTIQRMYSILRGEELDESLEEEPVSESVASASNEVTYNPLYPPEFFDFIIIDECHRSIYNLWMQVLDYFDAFQIGLTATPDKNTFAYFNKNVVSEYTHEQAVIDGVNVPGDVFVIKTAITENGGAILEPQKLIRERKTRKERWLEDDEIITYENAQLDKSVVAPDQIRTVLQTFKDSLPQMFPERYPEQRTQDPEVPKTLIFAKTDSHADDIIKYAREVFSKGNEFCKKITYKADDAEQALNELRNDANLRIAVTVSMIATGTDVKPLECLLFMRDVKSKNYFEQMRGRGTRTQKLDELRKVTPSALHNKDRFILIDAVGVTESKKIDSRPLDRKPSESLKNLMKSVAMGDRTSDTLTTLAGRLIRLDKILDDSDREEIEQHSENVPIKETAQNLLNIFDEDFIGDNFGHNNEKKEEFIKKTVAPFNNPKYRDIICKIKLNHEQYIDIRAVDTVTVADWQSTTKEQAAEIVENFKEYINHNKDRIDALSLIYSHDFKNRPLVYKAVQELYDEIKQAGFSNEQLWNAHFTLGNTDKKSPELQLADIIQIIRFTLDGEPPLSTFADSVRVKYRDWILAKNRAEGHDHFTLEQNEWLKTIRDQIISSVSVSTSSFEYGKLRDMGGIGKFYTLFGADYEQLLKEMNYELAA